MQHATEQKNMMVFSIALNGYQWLYRHCINSHREYADRINAEYVCVSRPRFTSMGIECCWLKLLLLREALNKGYQWVLFIDADAYVQQEAPDIRLHADEAKSIYMANGKTGRFNSGVILLRNGKPAKQFIDEVIASKGQPLAKAHQVGWGENGYIIQAAAANPHVARLPLQWNNTWQPDLADHIRHFNHGVMRNQNPHYQFYNLIHRYLAKFTRAMNTLRSSVDNLSSHNDVESTLLKLFTRTQKVYPQFF
ncbi:hypothetical protein [Planctobacterium marinum]|uniref:Nucleotide-diphospho-sugar transferase domain-containing protein n=1 Tax=Planctobacterium marinum TaxID=1631968 RepID=A0AA48HT67_9ALTE|nr:hypothetical protein MACH26_37680 [Planctobacterium marinum]